MEKPCRENSWKKYGTTKCPEEAGRKQNGKFKIHTECYIYNVSYNTAVRH
jgi:hypothetical protein